MFHLVSDLSFEIMIMLLLSLSMPLNILKESNMEKHNILSCVSSVLEE